MLQILENHPATVTIVTSIFTLLVGVGGILIGLRSYIKREREKAQFGFYINILVFLKRLYKILDEHPHVLHLLWDKAIRDEVFEGESQNDLSEAVAPILSELSRDFLDYLSNANNNVPPDADKPSKKEWSEWYNDILTLTEFLQKLTIIEKGNLFEFVAVEQIDSFNNEVENIVGKVIQPGNNTIGVITRIQQKIRKKISLKD